MGEEGQTLLRSHLTPLSKISLLKEESTIVGYLATEYKKITPKWHDVREFMVHNCMLRSHLTPLSKISLVKEE